ncbi:MAG: 4-aminobutyrate--2-oxoglutarate transaminase [Actinobacteria bacterium]|nr:4-aminobutyrate--2-oxoglutarate transaminase [Actinomycetota bacterium]|tara:strand:+ start:3580 stop:4845 length:1266 start_codon:yes stop_codon:yes gene_type:complete
MPQNMNSIKRNVPSAWYPTMDSFIAKGKNAEIWDKNNKRYLDFVGGYAVLNTGHLNPRVVRKVKNQLNDYSHSCFAFAPHENAVELCEQINKRYPIKEKTKTFLVNSGAEAVENAIKIAKYATGREKIIAFKGGFHGRTYLAMGLTGKEKPYKEGFGPFPKFISHIDFPYEYRNISDEKVLNQLENLLAKKINPKNVAAIVVEIQLGEGGYIPASENFLAKLRTITNKHKILLIFDEVQTGFGRTGEMFGASKVKVEPDMVTLAKGIGGGFPLAAVVGKAQIMDSVHDAGIGSTFGASPISCAAALGVLDVFDNDNLLDKVKKQETIMIKSLESMKNSFEFVGDVRGYGIMKGVEIVEDKKSKVPSKELASKIINNSKKNGLLLVNCGKEGNVIRFMGPLTTPLKQVKEAMEMFNGALEKI